MAGRGNERNVDSSSSQSWWQPAPWESDRRADGWQSVSRWKSDRWNSDWWNSAASWATYSVDPVTDSVAPGPLETSQNIGASLDPFEQLGDKRDSLRLRRN